MKLDELFRLLAEARRICGHSDYVVIGSNAALAFAGSTRLPDDMVMSVDVDCYTRDDPGRIFDLVKELGEDSRHHQSTGIFLDAVSPALPTLPDGWRDRLIMLEQGACRAWFLDPNDAAISKYARGDVKDLRWIRSGIAAGILSLPTIRMRAGRTTFADAQEKDRVITQIEIDSHWFDNARSAAAGVAGEIEIFKR
ncbi:MAG: hypothetical protein ISP90_07140 [Nevskia sp.]|nr:hypothetical protein [Nevskia sp.]